MNRLPYLMSSCATKVEYAARFEPLGAKQASLRRPRVSIEWFQFVSGSLRFSPIETAGGDK